MARACTTFAVASVLLAALSSSSLATEEAGKGGSRVNHCPAEHDVCVLPAPAPAQAHQHCLQSCSTVTRFNGQAVVSLAAQALHSTLALIALLLVPACR